MPRPLVLALALVALVGASACSSASAVTLPDINALHCSESAHAATQPSSLAALTELGSKERAPLDGLIVHSGHGKAGPAPAITVRGADEKALASELRAASLVACELRTPADAQRAGYVLSANFDQGVGSHWTNWNLVDAPFDATRPSMLLYGPRLGVTQLVGFSYWVRTSDPDGPGGFTGSADQWHRHYGLCFAQTGLLEREDVNDPTTCNGVYLNGGDIWMLHAWVVPGAANVWGVFAPLNPQLCSRNVADIARCPGQEGP